MNLCLLKDILTIKEALRILPVSLKMNLFTKYLQSTHFTKKLAECGVPGPNMYITGGNEATPHEYPWMAALFFEMNGQRYFCGGTLVIQYDPLKPNLTYLDPLGFIKTH